MTRLPRRHVGPPVAAEPAGLPVLGVHRSLRSLSELAEVARELRERQRLAAEEAARRAAEEASRRHEEELFVRTVGAVHPLGEHGRADLHRVRPAPVPRQRHADEAQVLRAALSDDFDPITLMETDDRLAWCRAGVGLDVTARLRSGAWSVQGQIDLHGLTRDAAREALAAFLLQAGEQGWRCVRVIHGKGLGSPGRQPVLKAKVQRWLAQREEVLAWAQARGNDGGAGALIVLLEGSSRHLRRLRRAAAAHQAERAHDEAR